MLIDSFQREITYLRISVTDRCNYRCTYCRPKENVEFKPYAEILRYEEIISIVDTAAELGITKVRLTGGEPLKRKNIESLICSISGKSGIKEITMTTNGSPLTFEKARELKQAGLNRINISLDTLNPEHFRKMTGGGEIKDVVRGIDAALQSALTPVKINMILFPHTKESEVREMRDFCSCRGIELQTIEKFSLHRKTNKISVAADRPLDCNLCNRLRLTADGYLLPCLFSDRNLKVDFKNIRKSIIKAVEMKPECGIAMRNRLMHQIGG